MNIRRFKKKLEKADAAFIDGIFDTVMDRKMKLYPDWDIIYLAVLKKDMEARKELMRFALMHMQE